MLKIDSLELRRFTDKALVPPQSVVVLVPFFAKKLSTQSIIEKIHKLPFVLNSLKRVIIPYIRVNVSGTRVDTTEFYNELKTYSKQIGVSKLYQITSDRELSQKIYQYTKSGYVFIDLYPLYKASEQLLERYANTPNKFFDLYFKIYHDYVSKVANQIAKVNNEFSSEHVKLYTVFIVDVHDTYMDIETELSQYVDELIQYMRTHDYEIPIPRENVSLLSPKLFASYIDVEKSYITYFGMLENNAYVVEPYMLRYTKRYVQNVIHAMQKYGYSIAQEDEIEKIVSNVTDYVQKNLNIEVDKNLHEFISNAIKRYVETTKTVPKNEPVLLLTSALRTVYNLNAKPENVKDLLLNHKINLIESKEIKPVINTAHKHIYDIENALKLKSTVIDIHEREYNERLDHYINMLFKTLEDNPINKIKVLGYKKTLKDDKLNRYWEYTFTIRNEDMDHDFDVKIKVPALINGRYFKLNGKTYILVNQQFLKPITVTDKNKVRFLTYYAIVHLFLKNYKLHINDINSVIEYIITKYKRYIDEVKENPENPAIADYIEPIKYDYIKFKKPYPLIVYGYKPIGSNRFLIARKYDKNGNIVEEIVYDKNEDKLYVLDSESNVKYEVPEKLNEFLFDLLTDIIEQINPEDKLSTSAKQLPYVAIYIGGFTLPYIVYMFANYGVKNTLDTIGIEYKISNEEDPKAYVKVRFKDVVVNIYARSLKQKYILNGLLIKDYPFNKYNFSDFENSQDVRNLFIKEAISQSAVKMFELMRRNLLDPITKQILKLDGYHDNLLEVFGKDLIDALFNSPVYHPADLRISRVRNSEVILNILYKQLAQAKTEYESRIAGKTNHKERIYIDSDYIIKELLSGESLLQYTESINPIDELNTATRITPKGIGGVPSAALTARQRMIPFFRDPKTGKWVSAHFHNVSANDTNEYSNIGVNQELTWSSLIGSRFGFFALQPDISNTTFESLGIGESLAPMIQSIDHDRAIKMAQQMRQSLPIINPHIPLVSSGAEFLIPQVTSSKFVIKAEKDGKVVDIKEGKYILVEYDDGTKKLYNIIPRISRTKRGLYLPLELVPEVSVGQRVKKGQVLATTSQLQKGVYRHGRNVCVAVMQYNGGGYEDGWVVSESALEGFEYYEYKEVIAIVPTDSIVKEFVYKPGTVVKRGQPLIRFEYKSSLDEYLETTEILSNESGDVDEDNLATVTKNSAGEIVIKSPYDGVIHNVKIYINGKVDPLIEKAWNQIVKEQEKLIKTAEQVNGDKFEFADSVDTSMFKRGGHKWKSKEFQGALIMIFIKTKKKPGFGSKFVFRGGNKGTVTYIIPKGKEPIAKETKLKIEWIHNPLSIIGRKNPNFLKEVAIGKIMYFLNKKAKEMAEDKDIPTKDIKKLVIDVFSTLCKDEKNKICHSLIENVKNIDDQTFRKLCKQIDPLENPLFVYFAIPFTKVKQEDINTAAKILDIPLEEYVYCPELGCTTEQPILVGFAYVIMLEHEPDSMMGYRSTGKYNLIGQGQKI
jgi:hypothetical protein